MKRSLSRLVAALLAVTLLVAAGPARAAETADAEAASHGDEAATYQVVDVYQYPGFRLVQFNLAVLSHYSYLLISGPEALVIDPGRDTEVYLATAEKEKTKITGVLLTHSHADFVAGHTELADRLKVPVYISAKAGAEYPCKPLTDGQTIDVGAAVVKFIETPGHTPDSMCAVLSAKGAPDKPLALLTGDTLFIGSVGRPDLMGEGMSAARLASDMFDTWTEKLSKLPDSVQIFPAHGAGSLCGAHLSDEPTSTIGQQRISNPYLANKSRGEFVAAVLEGLPEAPQYFKHNAAMNRQGPPLVEWGKKPESIAASKELTDAAKYYVADIRDAKAYAAGHVPNSINIGLRGRFETWTGIMVPWGASLVLVGEPKDLDEAVHRLHRVGYEARVMPVAEWEKAGLPAAKTGMVAPRELFKEMNSAESPLVVDVRLPKEWMGLRIGTVLNLPLNHLSESTGKLDKSQPVVTVCNSAYRSMMAAGILERAGFQSVSNLAGGGEAWAEAGLPVYEAHAAGPAGSAPKRVVKLAERVSADELKRMLMDMPGSFQIVDIRPAAQFSDYRLPESANVEIGQLIDNPAYLTGAGPLVVVDRDGSLAMMVAGILSQKTARPIKALFGGLEAYWDEAGPGAAVNPAAMPSLPAAAPSAAPAATPALPAPSEPTARPKKKSAGC